MAKKEKPHNPEYNDVGMSLIKTIASPDLGALTQDFGEIALDSILKDGILKEIPVISSIVGVTKVALSIRDKLLARKLLKFLHELSDTTEDERREFLHELEGDPKEQRKVGENLILLLDRLDNLDKPAMVAKFMKSYLQRQISYDEFVYYSSIVDRASMLDISRLLLYFSGGLVDEGSLGEKFHHLGLSFIMITLNPNYRHEPENLDDAMIYRFLQEGEPANRPNLRYKLSNPAYSFAKIILGDKYQHRELELTDLK